MAEERAQRRLAAILAADVVGYSRLMQLDEAGTLAALKARRRDVFQPAIARHRGRIVKVMGDGVLVEFASAVDAVECAVVLQEAMEAANAGLPEDRRIVLRVGINLGDVMVEGGDLYGDGVNIAARLESLAEPGSVFISGKVRQEVANKLALSFEDLGEQNLKNIAERVQIYRVCAPVAAPGGVILGETVETSKRSIAVLPFTNMSGDPEQEYFSDGITEDIITDLSKISALNVLSRNTVFTFKGKPVEVGKIARQLNVGHVVEGSIRKSGGRVRITAQLIDASQDRHLWAERYDRDLVDIFAVQDEIVRSIVDALKLKLLPQESELIGDRSTSNAEAYECYLQGRAKFLESWGSKSTMRAARKLLCKAAEIDPGYARAYAGIAGCDAYLWLGGDAGISYVEIVANSDKALHLAPDLPEAHASRGVALYLTGHSKDASAAFARALELDPVLFGAHFFFGLVLRDLGDLDSAASAFQRAAALRTDDFSSLALLAEVNEVRGRRADSKAAARRNLIRVESILNRNPDAADVLAMGAASAVYLENYAQAEEWAQRAVQLEPDNFSARYNAACAYAVMGKPNIAMVHLEYIHSRVPRARNWLSKIIPVESQLDSLRDREDFKQLLRRLETDTPSPTSSS